MKSVFMILFLLGGLAISNADAQSCKPCPPGCTVAPCKPGTSADATQTLLPGAAALAACTPEQMASCTPEQIAACTGKKMSKKEAKQCEAACQAKVAATPTGQAVLAGQPATVSTKPVAAPNNSKQ